MAHKYEPGEHYKKYGKKWFEKNKERELTRNSEYYFANKDKVIKRTSERSLKTRYGLTPSDLILLYEKQNGVCAICGKPPKEGRNLDVDHCHITKTIRGLLCNNCNRGLGHFQDNPQLLSFAAWYLETTKI